MKYTEAKLVILLSQLPVTSKNVFDLSVKLDRSYQTTYMALRVMEAKGLVLKHKTPTKKVFYLLRSPKSAVETAKKVLEAASDVLPEASDNKTQGE